MEPLARIIAGFFRSWWWGDPLLLPDRTDVVRPAREFVQGGWRNFAWFFFGSGMGRPKPNAESGVGFAISLLGVVLAGTVGLGTAVHKTGSEGPGTHCSTRSPGSRTSEQWQASFVRRNFGRARRTK